MTIEDSYFVTTIDEYTDSVEESRVSFTVDTKGYWQAVLDKRDEG